jgi:hypothetical protein
VLAMRIGEFLVKTTLVQTTMVQTTMARVLSESRLMLCLCLAAVCPIGVAAQSITPDCQPEVSNLKTVVTAARRKAAGNKAIPPITDRQNGFAWPDSEFGVFKNDTDYTFFASDGAHHDGNNKYGSVTRTFGTLDNPVGSAPPIDVIIHPNPDPAVNPNYRSYTYLGGGRIYRVPAGRPGAGRLLDVYHAEINTTTSFYSLLGLAVSSDDGLYWTDLGEIIRPNQPYEADLAGFDIGSPRLVDSPDGRYFYVYFPDWIANGTTQPTTATIVSLARAPIRSVLEAAFGEDPHAAAFEKYYDGGWSQPGIGGLSTDLNPSAGYGGSSNVAYDSAFGRYVMITDDTQHIAYAESVDGLSWTLPVLLEQDENSQTSFDYAVPIGIGDDPNLLGGQFYVFYTYGSAQGWPGNTVRRFTVACKCSR